MDSKQEKQLKELRERLALLDGVIAQFERLDAIRKRKQQTYTAAAGSTVANSQRTQLPQPNANPRNR